MLLDMRGIRKVFGPVVALDNVNFAVKPGEIHGLLGGNGAGKTTLMNVLFGLYKPEQGGITFDGRPLSVKSPRDALNHGIGMVHQQFLQVTNFTVAENIVLGAGLPNRPTMNLSEPKREIKEIASRFGLTIDPDARLDALPMGLRQQVEICKTLYRGAKLLILDEPTTMLTPQQVDKLFASLREMVRVGLSVVFITHKLREVLSVCDRITVLRHGKTIVTLDRAEANEDAFVRAMVGDEMSIEKSVLFAKQGLEQQIAQVSSAPQLQLTNVSLADRANEEGHSALNEVSFTLHKGEILGIAGVAGNGQHELAEAVMGVRPIHKGKIMMGGDDVSRQNTAHIISKGVAYVPENRWEDGILQRSTVAQNMLLGAQRNGGNMLNMRAIRHQTTELIKEFKIKTGGADALAAELSGGNMQRVQLARAFSQNPRILLAHNPTQGLDIPSIEFVYNKILQHKKDGMATLLISENLDELFLLCNRILVMYRGQIMGELQRNEFDAYRIGQLMSGVKATAETVA